MNKSDTKQSLITTPFDKSGATSRIESDDWTLPASSNQNPNWNSGFPSVYGLPLVSGGKYVKRSEMNHILRVLSNLLFNAQNGSPNVWSKAVSDALLGYPEDATVWYYYDNSWIMIRSNGDNNETPPVSGSTVNIDLTGGKSKAWAKVDLGLLSKNGGTLANDAVTFTKGGASSTLTFAGGTGTTAGKMTLKGQSEASLSAGDGTNRAEVIVNGGTAKVKIGTANPKNIVTSVLGVAADSSGNVPLTGVVKSVEGQTPNTQGDVTIPSMVKKVNNTSPDTNGNVELSIVKSVNNALPDESGNVQLALPFAKSVNNISPDESGNIVLPFPQQLGIGGWNSDSKFTVNKVDLTNTVKSAKVATATIPAGCYLMAILRVEWDTQARMKIKLAGATNGSGQGYEGFTDSNGWTVVGGSGDTSGDDQIVSCFSAPIFTNTRLAFQLDGGRHNVRFAGYITWTPKT